MKTTISSRGKVALPAELARKDGLRAGQELEVVRVARGVYRLVAILPRPNPGVVAWLRSCPEKGCFVSIESELTNTLLGVDAVEVR